MLHHDVQRVNTSASYPLNCLDIAFLACSKVIAATPVSSASGDPTRWGLCTWEPDINPVVEDSRMHVVNIRDAALGDALPHVMIMVSLRPSVSGYWEFYGTDCLP